MRLIYITGIDGCGKTTQSKMLSAYLNENGFKAQYQWLRWSPSIGKIISILKKSSSGKINNEKKWSNNDIDLQCRENDSYNKWTDLKAGLFSISVFKYLWIKYATWDYYYSYKKVSSNWCSDFLVLDRYYFDFIVDQSLNFREPVIDFEKRVETGYLKKFRQPDLFILIDISPEIGWDRKKDGTSMAHLIKIEKAYKSITARKDVHVINGTQTANEIHHEIRGIAMDLLEDKNGI